MGEHKNIHPLPHMPLLMEAGGASYLARSALDRLWCGHRAWSDATFGDRAERGPVGSLKHLAKEALEAAENPADVTEFADCLFLLWDAAHRAGHSMDDIVEAGFRKLQVLNTRSYPKTPDGEPSEHDRSGGAVMARRPKRARATPAQAQPIQPRGADTTLTTKETFNVRETVRKEG